MVPFRRFLVVWFVTFALFLLVAVALGKYGAKAIGALENAASQETVESDGDAVD